MEKAQDIMTKSPATVLPETPVREAAQLMKAKDVGILPVVAAKGSARLVGVITDRDIAIRCVSEGRDSSRCTVRDLMSSEIRTARADDSVEDVMKLMGDEQIRRVPIVDGHGNLVGIVAQADIVREADNEHRAEQTIEEISREGGKHAQ